MQRRLRRIERKSFCLDALDACHASLYLTGQRNVTSLKELPALGNVRNERKQVRVVQQALNKAKSRFRSILALFDGQRMSELFICFLSASGCPLTSLSP